MPIDWNYDFYAHGWDKKGGSINPQHITDCIGRLRLLEVGEYEATTDGGWPRIGWGEVLDTDMREQRIGEPQPAFLLWGTYGAQWHPWYMLTSIRKKNTKEVTV